MMIWRGIKTFVEDMTSGLDKLTKAIVFISLGCFAFALACFAWATILMIVGEG